MDYSTPGFPILHSSQSLLKSMSIESVIITISSSAALFSFCLQSFPAPGSFPMSRLLASGGQSIGASASVLLMNIQGWFPSGLTSLISLLSKGLSRVLSFGGQNFPWLRFSELEGELGAFPYLHTSCLPEPQGRNDLTLIYLEGNALFTISVFRNAEKVFAFNLTAWLL